MFRNSVTINRATAFPPPPKGTEASKVTPEQCAALVPTLCDHLMFAKLMFSSVQWLSRIRLFVTPWTAAGQASLSITNYRSLLKLMSIDSVCHPAISSSVVPFSSCPQSLPASGSFKMTQLFAWGGQSIGVSALASVLPKNTQGWSPSEWTGWISL